MTEKDHLNRPILKLNSFNNKSDELVSSSDISTSVKDSKDDTKVAGSSRNKAMKPTVKENESTKDTQKTIPKPTKQKKLLLTTEEYQEVLAYMQTHFPHAFPVDVAPLPLAVGIHNQILDLPDLPFARMKIRKFLKIYVSKRDYRKELIVDNNRFNLDGTLASKILPEETNWLVWKKVRAGRKAELQAKHDSFVKKVMENPIAASGFLEEFVPAEYLEVLDLSTLKVEKESYVEDSLKKRLSDIVYSLQTKPNNEGKTDTTFVYAIVEHQVSPDYWIAFRLWKYSLLLLERHTKKRNKLPVIIPLVLYNGKKKYNVPINLWELFTYPTLAKKAMADDYHLINLNAMADSDIDYEKHLSFVLYTLKHIHDRDTLKMLEEAMQKCTKALIIDKGKDYVHTKLILWYTDSKVPAENKQLLEQLIVDNLPKEDTDKIMRTIADTYIEEGFNKGILKGVEQGKNEGITIGKNEGIAIGEARGVEKGILKIALRMLQEKTDIKFISSVTGLSTDEILKIQNNM